MSVDKWAHEDWVDLHGSFDSEDDEEWPECPNCQDEGCTLCTPDCVEEIIVKAADHPNDWSATLYRHRE